MKTLWVLSGIPGSGKSTWARQKVASTESAIRISRDDIRFSLLKEDDDYFSYEDLVIQTFISNITTAIEKGYKNIYIDATHLNDRKRWQLLDNIDFNNEYEIIIVIFDTPLQTCIERNNMREGKMRVPEKVIRNMYKSFQKDSTAYDYMVLKEGEV